MKKEVSQLAKVELKKPIVEEIKNCIDGASSVVLVNYQGITVEQDTKLRAKLREENVLYKVYKNTMMNFAFEGTEFDSLSKHLEGANALAVSKDDATVAARVLAEFAKEAPALEVVAGVIEGKYEDTEGMKALASIPSRDVLLGRLLGSIQSPVTNFARVLKQIAEKDGTEEVASEEVASEE